jgi:hypothetical protein
VSLRVTVVDVETSESAEALVADGDYIVICADPSYLAGAVFRDQGRTHVVTIKGRIPAPEAER